MVLVLELSDETWHDVFHNAPEWDKLTPGGSPGKKNSSSKKGGKKSSKGNKKKKR